MSFEEQLGCNNPIEVSQSTHTHIKICSNSRTLDKGCKVSNTHLRVMEECELSIKTPIFDSIHDNIMRPVWNFFYIF